MPLPASRQLLRQHALAFAVSFVALTTLLVANYAARGIVSGAAAGGRSLEAIAMAIPFTAALTIPMSVLIAVLWVFARLGRDGVLQSAWREGDGSRRLVVPVLAASVVVAALNLILNAQVVPRANGRLLALQSGEALARSDRTMTIAELRHEAREVRRVGGSGAVARAATYEVEVQKKIALAAACVVLALVGIASALLVPRGGAKLVIGASSLVLGAYYALVVMGESLADRLVVSPLVGMWIANVVLGAIAALVLWKQRTSPAPNRRAPIALGA